MISYPNGGGLTPAVADELADLLGGEWRVVATLHADRSVQSIRVLGPDRHGYVRLEPASGSAEWWVDHYDPNGAPSRWCDYDPARSSGAPELAALVHR